VTVARNVAGGARTATGNTTADIAARLLGWAQNAVNRSVPYVSGGAGQVAADCSSYVNWIYYQAGISLGGYNGGSHGPIVADLATYGRNVPLAGSTKLNNAVPGNVLIYSEPGEGPNSHTALYAGVINGVPMDYEESHSGEDAHLIPVDIPHLTSIRNFYDGGPGIVGRFNTKNPGATGAEGTSPAETAGVWNYVPGGSFVRHELGKGASAVSGDVVGAITGWFEGEIKNYGVRAVLIVFGAAAIIIGLWRIVQSNQTTGKAADGAADASGVPHPHKKSGPSSSGGSPVKQAAAKEGVSPVEADAAEVAA
jgi:hypothetical protein